MTTTTELRELGAQITAALEHLPPDATAVIRVRHGAGSFLTGGELWVTSGPGQIPARACELPATVGLRMSLVERALDEAGLAYPKADLGLRARWRRVMSAPDVIAGYELAVRATGDRPQSPPISRHREADKT
ncbi:hypothetical protein [Promicromonospora iranensis]|uniref:Acetamidase/formamidase n=1 Tax=Promicromonospora iranensis TaxID=1105144 RepID=A0ABU2CIM2_9MICO|nr:hypothetical protein [Promicromonospora iranensis]MDR7381163.1 acetamidase/formamidase [Promicromonospora iranensis]